jgi:hypothetical protein
MICEGIVDNKSTDGYGFLDNYIFCGRDGFNWSVSVKTANGKYFARCCRELLGFQPDTPPTPSAYSAVALLDEEGLLELHKHTLTFLDYPALCELAGAELEHLSTCDIAPGLSGRCAE